MPGPGSPSRRRQIVLALSLVPFSGIAFLWFIGVVRDRIGQHEDRFFATVLLGGGLLFVAMLFAASAVTAGYSPSSPGRDGAVGGASGFSRRVGSLVPHTYAMRMAAVFTISTTTIGLRTGVLPRWLGFSGYAMALVLLLVIDVTPWVELLFPLWIFLGLDTLVASLAAGERAGSRRRTSRFRSDDISSTAGDQGATSWARATPGRSSSGRNTRRSWTSCTRSWSACRSG